MTKFNPLPFNPALEGDDENDAIMDAYLDKIKHEYKDGWTEENWEEEMEKHPMFMTKMPGADDEVPEALEALQQLQWDPDQTPEEKAIKYKEEGNFNFKCKNYKRAIISYTEGLKEKIEDNKELMSILHNNRATSHFYLKNYRSAFNDACFARKFNKKNLKAILKGAESCHELKMYDDAIQWCESALSLNPDDEKAKELRKKCEVSKKSYEKEKRKKEAEARKYSEKQKKILNLIKTRGIQVQEKDSKFIELLENPQTPLHKRIEISELGDSLMWPVVLLYPEFGQTEFIEAFDEYSIFDDHLQMMFGEVPEWDQSGTYKYQNLEVYYEDQKRHKLVKVKNSSTLLEVLQKEGNYIQLGTPKFFVMVKDSEFKKIYIDKYNEIA